MKHKTVLCYIINVYLLMVKLLTACNFVCKKRII